MFRKDIQALRAFAVAIVIGFHAGLPLFAAGFIGVDVFFVISGFLIIGLLTKELERTGRIDLLSFLGRRSRRLIPAASFVLFASALLVVWYLPGPRGSAAFVDIATASFYAANLRFATVAMDYWAAESVSPIVHYWSLGVEEQFYVMFPIALVLVVAIARKSRLRIIEVLLGLVVVASFTVMMSQMSTTSAWGFYSPLGRAWEFAIGGLAATVGRAYILKSDRAREIVAWTSVGTLAFCAIAFDPKASFPSVTTAIPVVATAVLLWNGIDNYPSNSPFLKLVSLRPFQSLGTWSYSTYLWHWPVLFFGAIAFDPNAASPEAMNSAIAVVLIGLSIGLAALTNIYVEDPIRNHSKLKVSSIRSLAVGLALSTSVAVFALSLEKLNFQHLSSRPIISDTKPVDQKIKNSQAVTAIIRELSPKLQASDVEPVSLQQVRKAQSDFPVTATNGCHTSDGDPDLPNGCYFGDLSSEKLVVLFGNSHANQFFSAIDMAGKNLGFKVLHRTHSGCSIADITTTRDGRPWDACHSWRKATVSETKKLKPTVVVMVGGITVSGVIDPQTDEVATKSRKEALTIAGIRSTAEEVAATGAQVLFIRNTPNLPVNPIDCLASRTVSACVEPMNDALDPTTFSTDAVGGIPNVTPVDLTLALCQVSTCAPIRGGNFVWRDTHHITDSYAKTLSPLFQALLKPLLKATNTPTP